MDHIHSGGDEHGEQLFENKELFNPAFKCLMGFEAWMLTLDKFKTENNEHISNSDSNSRREKSS